MNKRIFLVVWRQFSQRKLRSLLTVLGITIGISAMISLILLSGALKQGITGQLDSFGSDVILAAPKAGLEGSGNGGPKGIGKFTTKDADIIESLPQVESVQELLRINMDAEVGREKRRVEIRGTEISDDFIRFLSMDIESGRYLESDDRYSINIGHRVATEMFDKELFVGNSIQMNGQKFTIVGIFKEEGNLASDNLIVGNIETIRDVLGVSDAVTALSIRISPGADLDLMDQRIRNALEDYRGEEDFATITPAGIKEEIGQLLGVVDIVVLSIAFVSLFVASLGIMNSLYTSVLQRTKEIGTMKAVGATNFQIFSIFVTESAILGAAGGICGIIFGAFLAFLFMLPLNAFGFVKFTFEPDYMLFLQAFLFSVILGIFAGTLPALKAARLRPVDALRYE
ncbi:MAG TPA: ABC transporter permease [Acidobacteriota bacterium]|nr:ABC transporter permease [Acidobacteriota bacterium]